MEHNRTLNKTSTDFEKDYNLTSEKVYKKISLIPYNQEIKFTLIVMCSKETYNNSRIVNARYLHNTIPIPRDAKQENA